MPSPTQRMALLEKELKKYKLGKASLYTAGNSKGRTESAVTNTPTVNSIANGFIASNKLQAIKQGISQRINLLNKAHSELMEISKELFYYNMVDNLGNAKIESLSLRHCVSILKELQMAGEKFSKDGDKNYSAHCEKLRNRIMWVGCEIIGKGMKTTNDFLNKFGDSHHQIGKGPLDEKLVGSKQENKNESKENSSHLPDESRPGNANHIMDSKQENSSIKTPDNGDSSNNLPVAMQFYRICPDGFKENIRALYFSLRSREISKITKECSENLERNYQTLITGELMSYERAFDVCVFAGRTNALCTGGTGMGGNSDGVLDSIPEPLNLFLKELLCKILNKKNKSTALAICMKNDTCLADRVFKRIVKELGDREKSSRKNRIWKL